MIKPTPIQIKQAQELLDNQTLLDILDQRREDIRDMWQTSTDCESREACYYEVRALEDLKDGIYSTIKDIIRRGDSG